MVYVAAGISGELPLVLKAMAFIVVFTLTIKGPIYCVPDGLGKPEGIEPSVVYMIVADESVH